MKKTLFILSLFLLIVNCSKSSDPKTETEPEFDINEGQTNWAKNVYQDITENGNFISDGFIGSIGVNDIAIRAETILMVGSAFYAETAGRVWRSDDSGETWKIIAVGACGAGNFDYDVAFPSDNVIYVLGECFGGFHLRKWVDGEWSFIDTGGLGFGKYHNPMHFFDENVGIIANIKTTDGGVTWTTIEDLKDYPSFENGDVVNGVIVSNYFIDNQIGYCTSFSDVFKTNNGGDNWVIVHSDPSASFREMYFISENVGFITTDTELMKTNDSGITWTPVLSTFVKDISFVTDEIGFVAGTGGIFKTTDKGNSWELNYASNFISLRDCCISNKVNNGFTAIAFDGENIGIAAGFQFNSSKELLENFPNLKAYIARTTTLGE